MAHKEFNLILPVAIVGRVDLGRVQREIGQIHTALQAQALRSPGTVVGLPKLSQLLDEFVQANKLNLLEISDRSTAVEFLEDIKNNSPRVHVSFSADPSAQFMAKITTWFDRMFTRRYLLPLACSLELGLAVLCGRQTNILIFRSVNHLQIIESC